MNIMFIIAVVGLTLQFSTTALLSVLGRAPRWRRVRWFGAVTLTAGCYSTVDAVAALRSVDAVDTSWSLQFNLVFATLHGAAWLLFTYMGPSGRWESLPLWVRRVTVAGSIVALIASLSGQVASAETSTLVVPAFDVSVQRSTLSLLGNLLALVSGLAYGTLLVGLRWLSQRDANASCAVVAWGNVANVPLALVAGAAMGQGWTSGDASSWVSIVVLGTLQVGLAYALLVRAMPHVPAVSASLLLMIEPALNPLLAYLAHGEVPHAAAVVGGLVILGAVLAGSWRKK
jgi:drug/metabolite transporter (DMT)-like permease